jgi:hypothetical protein
VWSRYPHIECPQRTNSGRLMSDSLKHYMVTLATDVDALTAFIMDPIKAIKEAGLTEEDAAVLTSGDQSRIYVALSGIKTPVVTQPAAQQSTLASQSASAAPGSATQQPSPAYPVVVGWSGTAAQPVGHPPPAYTPPAGSSSAYPAPAYPSPPYPSPVYPAPFYSQQPYPPQAGSAAVPAWITDWVARWWASVSGPASYPPPPTWPPAYPGSR